MLIDLERAQQVQADTVEEIYQVYLSEHGPRVQSQQTLDLCWRHLKPEFGHLRPDQITLDISREYATKRRQAGIKDGTIRRELGTLVAILHWKSEATPAVVELPPAPPPKDFHLTREQYRALRDAAAKVPHLHLFIILAYTTAGRAGAILDLTWDRVDFERGLIRLDRQGVGQDTRSTKRRSIVPMTDNAREALEQAQRLALTDHVIEYAGRPVLSIKRGFQSAVERARLPSAVTPHTLRHTAAVHMVESGVAMSLVAQYLGHTDERITYRVYARFSPTYLKEAARALE